MSRSYLVIADTPLLSICDCLLGVLGSFRAYAKVRLAVPLMGFRPWTRSVDSTILYTFFTGRL